MTYPGLFTYKVHFSRYANGVREQSAALHIQSKNWRRANSKAEDYLDAMKCNDPSREYEIVSLELTGLGGEWHTGSQHGIWHSD